MGFRELVRNATNKTSDLAKEEMGKLQSSLIEETDKLQSSLIEEVDKLPFFKSLINALDRILNANKPMTNIPNANSSFRSSGISKTEYKIYHREKDGFCDNMNYQLYQCKALYSRTNRKRTVKFEVFNEDDVKIQLLRDGFCEPFDIKRIPFPRATDAQINNIKTYITKIPPDDICLYDASAMISCSCENDSVPHPDLIQYATEMKLKFSYYIGKKALYNLIFNSLDMEDKIAFFVFCIYRFTTDDRRGNLNKSPYKNLFYDFSSENLSNEQFIKSMNRYTGSELRYFGKLTIGNIETWGGSTNTIAYKNVIVFLKKHFTLKNISSKKIEKRQL